MSTTVTRPGRRPGVAADRPAPTGPSFAALTGIEIRKSLSTRSGKAVAALAVLRRPARRPAGLGRRAAAACPPPMASASWAC